MTEITGKNFSFPGAKRVFFIGSVPPDHGGKGAGGGVSTHVWELAGRLSASGFQVSLLARNIEHSFTFENIKVIAFREVALWRVFSRSYWNRLTGFAVELIHFHHLNPLVILFRMIYRGKVKIVATVHSFNRFKEGYRTPKENINAILIRLEARLVDLLIYPAGYILKEAPTYLGKVKVPQVVVHNPVEITGFEIHPRQKAKESLKLDLNRKTLLFVGTLNVHKGVGVLLEAFEKISLRSPERYELVIISDGPLRNLVLEYAGRSDIHVRYEGIKDREQLGAYYNAADLFVMPSRGEGWGFVYGESLLCGTPVIACDISGVKDVLGGKYGVHFVPVDQPDALAKEIEMVLAQSFQREKLRRSALDLGWENRVSEFIELYARVSGRN